MSNSSLLGVSLNSNDSITQHNSQSNEQFLQNQDLALTSNQTNVESIVDSKQDNNSSKEVSDLEKSFQSGHKEEAKRRRTRRSKKRKWQTRKAKRFQWTESSEQEVKRLHMKVVEHGQPLAPYNTTQFIMNEHNSDKEINFDEIHGRIQRMHRQKLHQMDNNDDDFYSSPEDESDYLQQQFHEAYDNIHAERLNSMNKNELVSEYLQLEDRVEDLEKRLKESKAGRFQRSISDSGVQTEHYSSDVNDDDSGTEIEEHFMRKADIFQEEIKKLSEENKRLKSENERLQNIINEINPKVDSPNHSSQLHNHQNREPNDLVNEQTINDSEITFAE
jgi:protein HEXIM1/2